MWYKKSPILFITILFLFVLLGLDCTQETTSVITSDNETVIDQAGVIFRNPRVYNVDYSFELIPDPGKIDRTKDLKLWVPLPR